MIIIIIIIKTRARARVCVCVCVCVLIKTYLLEVTLCGDVAGLRDTTLLGVWQRK